MSLVVLTNIPTPYRTAFFDALAEAAALLVLQKKFRELWDEEGK